MRGRPKSREFVYIVYDVDLFELPVAYCETLDELGRFFGRSSIAMTQAISKIKHNRAYKRGYIRNDNGVFYTVEKYRAKLLEG